MSADCTTVRELIAELALDVAPAADRAAALEHVEQCPGCGNALTQAAATVDLLLSLAPTIPLPEGLRDSVLAANGGHRHRDSRRRRPQRSRLGWQIRNRLAAGVIAAAASALLIGVVIRDEGATAPPLSRTVSLQDAAGHDVGRAVLTGGRVPSLFLSFTARGPANSFHVLAFDQHAKAVEIGMANTADGICTFSHQLPVAVTYVRTLNLINAAHQAVYIADFTRPR